MKRENIYIYIYIYFIYIEENISLVNIFVKTLIRGMCGCFSTFNRYSEFKFSYMHYSLYLLN